MTKLEKNIILAINTLESNSFVTVKKCGLFLEKNGFSQNFAVVLDDIVIVRIDHSCKGIYKKILKYNLDIDKKIILGTDTITKFIINRFTEQDASEILENIFQYCDIPLIKSFHKFGLSLKDMVYNTAQYFDLNDEYFEILDNDKNFERIHNRFSTNISWFGPGITPTEIEREFDLEEWFGSYNQKTRDKILKDLINEK